MAKKPIKKDTPKPTPKPQMSDDSNDRKVKEPPDQSGQFQENGLPWRHEGYLTGDAAVFLWKYDNRLGHNEVITSVD